MISFIERRRPTFFYRFTCAFIAFSFFTSLIVPPPSAQAQTVLNLPVPGTVITISPGYTPTLLKGITLFPDNPLEFDFLVDIGESGLEGEDLRWEANKLIKYFLASVTVPPKELWVNLSPYEKDRIIPEGFGRTEMGRDLLSQDYILKQLTASLISPEDELGKKFWDRVYKKSYEMFGTTTIPTNTFNKIWIVPENAEVFVAGNSAYVIDSHLRVMMEEDYLALFENIESSSHGLAEVDVDEAKEISNVATRIVKEIVIPEIEKEVNEGKTFANLRQIYNSMILAAWFKRNLQQSLLGQVYMDQNKVLGVDVEDKEVKFKIYSQYMDAFRKGVHNFIKEEYDPASKQIIPRKYFTGGAVGIDPAEVAVTVIPVGADPAVVAPVEYAKFTNEVAEPAAAGRTVSAKTLLIENVAERDEFAQSIRVRPGDAAETARFEITTDDATQYLYEYERDRSFAPGDIVSWTYGPDGRELYTSKSVLGAQADEGTTKVTINHSDGTKTISLVSGNRAKAASELAARGEFVSSSERLIRTLGSLPVDAARIAAPRISDIDDYVPSKFGEIATAANSRQFSQVADTLDAMVRNFTSRERVVPTLSLRDKVETRQFLSELEQAARVASEIRGTIRMRARELRDILGANIVRPEYKIGSPDVDRRLVSIVDKLLDQKPSSAVEELQGLNNYLTRNLEHRVMVAPQMGDDGGAFRKFTSDAVRLFPSAGAERLNFRKAAAELAEILGVDAAMSAEARRKLAIDLGRQFRAPAGERGVFERGFFDNGAERGGWVNRPWEIQDSLIDQIESRVAALKDEGVETIVVFAMGGESSIMGPSDDKLINISSTAPQKMRDALARIDLERTRFFGVSKSFGTAETLTGNANYIESLYRAQGLDPTQYITYFTDPGDAEAKARKERPGFPIIYRELTDSLDGQPTNNIGGRNTLVNVPTLFAYAWRNPGELRSVVDAIRRSNTFSDGQANPYIEAAIEVSPLIREDGRHNLAIIQPEPIREQRNMFQEQNPEESLGDAGAFTVYTTRPDLGTLKKFNDDNWVFVEFRVPGMESQTQGYAEQAKADGHPVITIDVPIAGDTSFAPQVTSYGWMTFVAALGAQWDVNISDQPEVEAYKNLMRERDLTLDDGLAPARATNTLVQKGDLTVAFEGLFKQLNPDQQGLIRTMQSDGVDAPVLVATMLHELRDELDALTLAYYDDANPRVADWLTNLTQNVIHKKTGHAVKWGEGTGVLHGLFVGWFSGPKHQLPIHIVATEHEHPEVPYNKGTDIIVAGATAAHLSLVNANRPSMEIVVNGQLNDNTRDQIERFMDDVAVEFSKLRADAAGADEITILDELVEIYASRENGLFFIVDRLESLSNVLEQYPVGDRNREIHMLDEILKFFEEPGASYTERAQVAGKKIKDLLEDRGPADAAVLGADEVTALTTVMTADDMQRQIIEARQDADRGAMQWLVGGALSEIFGKDYRRQLGQNFESRLVNELLSNNRVADAVQNAADAAATIRFETTTKDGVNYRYEYDPALEVEQRQPNSWTYDAEGKLLYTSTKMLGKGQREGTTTVTISYPDGRKTVSLVDGNQVFAAKQRADRGEFLSIEERVRQDLRGLPADAASAAVAEMRPTELRQAVSIVHFDPESDRRLAVARHMAEMRASGELPKGFIFGLEPARRLVENLGFRDSYSQEGQTSYDNLESQQQSMEVLRILVENDLISEGILSRIVPEMVRSLKDRRADEQGATGDRKGRTIDMRAPAQALLSTLRNKGFDVDAAEIGRIKLIDSPLLDQSLDDIARSGQVSLSARAETALSRAGISTLREALTTSDDELFRKGVAQFILSRGIRPLRLQFQAEKTFIPGRIPITDSAVELGRPTKQALFEAGFETVGDVLNLPFTDNLRVKGSIGDDRLAEIDIFRKRFTSDTDAAGAAVSRSAAQADTAVLSEREIKRFEMNVRSKHPEVMKSELQGLARRHPQIAGQITALIESTLEGRRRGVEAGNAHREVIALVRSFGPREKSSAPQAEQAVQERAEDFEFTFESTKDLVRRAQRLMQEEDGLIRQIQSLFSQNKVAEAQRLEQRRTAVENEYTVILKEVDARDKVRDEARAVLDVVDLDQGVEGREIAAWVVSPNKRVVAFLNNESRSANGATIFPEIVFVDNKSSTIIHRIGGQDSGLARNVVFRDLSFTTDRSLAVENIRDGLSQVNFTLPEDVRNIIADAAESSAPMTLDQLIGSADRGEISVRQPVRVTLKDSERPSAEGRFLFVTSASQSPQERRIRRDVPPERILVLENDQGEQMEYREGEIVNLRMITDAAARAAKRIDVLEDLHEILDRSTEDDFLVASFLNDVVRDFERGSTYSVPDRAEAQRLLDKILKKFPEGSQYAEAVQDAGAKLKEKLAASSEMAPEFSRQLENRGYDDAAGMAQEVISIRSVEAVRQENAVKGADPVGGIDLNPALLNLQIKRDGNGIPLPINMQPIENMKIDGFMPVIINVIPVTNLPLILGFKTTPDEKRKGVDSDRGLDPIRKSERFTTEQIEQVSYL